MAATVTCKLLIDEGGASSTNSVSIKASIVLTGDGAGEVIHQGVVQAVSTSWEAADVGDVTTASDYRILVRNMDDTNNLLGSMDAGTTEHFDLPPGDFFYAPLQASRALHLKFVSAAGTANVVVCEN